MTRFEDLTQNEQAAILQARAEERALRGIYASAAYSPTSASTTFAQSVSAAVDRRLGGRRYRAAHRQEPTALPFAEALIQAVNRRRKR
jgi:hypothetical protein